MKKHIIWLIIGLLLLALCIVGLKGCNDKVQMPLIGGGNKVESNAAAEVDALIDKINNPVTLEDKGAIEAARAAYDALSDEDKAKVTKLPVLEDAEAALKNLEAGTADDAALQAAAVDELINKISDPVTLDSEADIMAAREAYDALSDEAKAKVKNLAILESAEAALAKLKGETEGNTDEGNETKTFAEGDEVIFTGGNVYVSPTDKEAARVVKEETTCDVTITVEKGEHRYHLISNDGGKVYGWVDAENIKESK